MRLLRLIPALTALALALLLISAPEAAIAVGPADHSCRDLFATLEAPRRLKVFRSYKPTVLHTQADVLSLLGSSLKPTSRIEARDWTPATIHSLLLRLEKQKIEVIVEYANPDTFFDRIAKVSGQIGGVSTSVSGPKLKISNSENGEQRDIHQLDLVTIEIVGADGPFKDAAELLSAVEASGSALPRPVDLNAKPENPEDVVAELSAKIGGRTEVEETKRLESIEGYVSHYADDYVQRVHGYSGLSYKIIGHTLQISGVGVDKRKLESGINKLLMAIVLKNHPEINRIESSFISTNLIEILRQRRFGEPDAVMATPAYRLRNSFGFSRIIRDGNVFAVEKGTYIER